MTEKEAKASLRKLIVWMESFGIDIVSETEDTIIIEHPGGRQQEISNTELYFINGYLLGTLSKLLIGQY